ncbi:MAG: hypothetical protein ABUS57_03400 [Pseudomonadota bacterium]
MARITTLKRLTFAIAMACVMSSVQISGAEARLFTPQHDWWRSGALCAARRDPPGRAIEALPPLSCEADATTTAATRPRYAALDERTLRPKWMRATKFAKLEMKHH